MSDSTKLIDHALENWHAPMSRRQFVEGSGLFVLSFSGMGMMDTGRPLDSGSGSLLDGQALAQQAAPYPDPDFHQLDSWLVVHEDETATFYVGKTDGAKGQAQRFAR